MNKLKKFASLLLALVMALALAAPAFAEENYSITINNLQDGQAKTFAAYQIFAGDLAEENNTKVLSNIHNL